VSITIGLAALLDYSDHEREKWERWLAGDPARASLPLQQAGRFPTVFALLDHVFLVERRHLARLEGATPPGSTGVRAGDLRGLFEYAALVRADFRRYVSDTSDARAQERMTITLQDRSLSMTRQTLATHIVVHEIRHLAQLALAVRLAGFEPPGEHDYFYSVATR
jgi:uncharacterized damage-inducible protein DinB